MKEFKFVIDVPHWILARLQSSGQNAYTGRSTIS